MALRFAEDCSPARLVLGTATKISNIANSSFDTTKREQLESESANILSLPLYRAVGGFTVESKCSVGV